MAYRDVVIATGPSHLWRFDGDVVDSVGAVATTNTGFSFVGGALCADASQTARCSGTADRVTMGTTASLTGTTSAKAVAGWLRFNSIQLPPKSVYREGTTSDQFNLVCWIGNNILFEVVQGSEVRQAFADNVFVPGRTYHVFMRFEGSGGNDRFDLYVDGVKQSVSLPANGVSGIASLAGRTFPGFGDPTGATEVGNATVLLNGPEGADYNFWSAWINANVSAFTATTIREDLFEQGVLPEITISDQAGLDALASTERGNHACCIRVTGSGDLTLSADAVTFNPLASIHVQYMGTGTLTWINTNGSNASISSAPNGGSVNLVTPAVLTISELVPGSEVRFYEAGTETELDGVESVVGTSFSSSVQVAAVDVRILSLGYQIKAIKNINMTGGNVTAVAAQNIDRQYRND
jgi:hypothetical protein